MVTSFKGAIFVVLAKQNECCQLDPNVNETISLKEDNDPAIRIGNRIHQCMTHPKCTRLTLRLKTTNNNAPNMLWRIVLHFNDITVVQATCSR